MRSLALGLLLACSACSGTPASPPRPPQTAAASPTPATGAACPNQEAVAGDDAFRAGNPAAGDVDGDGEIDSVAIHFDPDGDAGCQAFVVAESAEDAIAAPLDTWRPDLGLPMPSLVTLEEVDGDPGVEVIVRMGAGASTEFVGIVTAEQGVLTQVSTKGADEIADGLFGFGGSVGHVEAVDCAPGGGVVSSFAAPRGDGYRVERRFLSFEGAELTEERVEVERVPVERIGRLPEYRASPFGSCSD